MTRLISLIDIIKRANSWEEIARSLGADPSRADITAAADEASKRCAVVDPGYETDKLEARIHELDLQVAYIFNTHGHHDHVAGNDVFRKNDVKLAAYKEAATDPDIKLDHGDEVSKLDASLQPTCEARQ